MLRSFFIAALFRNLQNLLILTAIKADRTRVMEYIQVQRTLIVFTKFHIDEFEFIFSFLAT